MEPATAGALYGVETAVEATVALATGLAKSTIPLKATFTPIPLPNPFPRSSHTLSIIKGQAYIFGGEIEPRRPVDNSMHMFTLPSSSVPEADYRGLPAVPEKKAGITTNNNPDAHGTSGEGREEVPAPRVGHTASVIGDRIFVFGGRGGKEMKPLEEHGRVWIFDTRSATWSYLDPAPGSPFPPGRSYHASAATEYPAPPPPPPSQLKFSFQLIPSDDTDGVGEAETSGEQLASTGYGTLFIHAGCTASGRLSDLWALDVASGIWVRFADAPGPARGGASLVVAQERLWRFGGFDGEKELGGQLDVIDAFAAAQTAEGKKKDGKDAVERSAPLQPLSAEWHSLLFDPSAPATTTTTTTTTTNTEDPTSRKPPSAPSLPASADADAHTPGHRSVSGLHALTTGQGRTYLVLLLGERAPSPRDRGHDAAGAFWDDVWCFQLPTRGVASAARWKDAARWVVGAKDEGKWARVHVDVDVGVGVGDERSADGDNNIHGDVEGTGGIQRAGPGARGWFASSVAADVDAASVFLWGGIDSTNRRFGDAWVLSVSG